MFPSLCVPAYCYQSLADAEENVQLLASCRNSTRDAIFDVFIALLYPLPKGECVFKISNSLPIICRNFSVANDSKYPGYLFCLRYCKALAHDADSTCAASRTFIFCFLNSKCDLVSLLAKFFFRDLFVMQKLNTLPLGIADVRKFDDMKLIKTISLPV